MSEFGKKVAPKYLKNRRMRIRNAAIRNNRVFVGARLDRCEWDPRWEKLREPNLLKPPRTKLYLRNRDLKYLFWFLYV